MEHRELADFCFDLLEAYKSLHERASKNSDNSSLSPSSDFPWKCANDNLFGQEAKEGMENAVSEAEEKKSDQVVEAQRKKRDRGYGRTQKLPITRTVNLYPDACSECGKLLDEQNSTCFSAYHQVDLEKLAAGVGEYQTVCTQYRLHKIKCACGVTNKYNQKEILTSEKKLTFREWRLVGPTLASVILYLKFELRVTHRKIRHALLNLYGIQLSLGSLCRCIH